MRKVLLVVRHEILVTLQKRSFWFMTFIFPLAIIAFNLASQVLAGDLAEGSGNPLLGPQPGEFEPVGYVDRAGIVAFIPDAVPAGWLRAYETEDAALADLRAGRIGLYVVIEPDYVDEGNLTVVDDDYAILGTDPARAVVQCVIDANLVGDPDRALAFAALEGDSRYISRMESLAPQVPSVEEEEPQQRTADPILPFVAVFILFFVITSSGGYVLQSVAAEKENRTMEVLLVSLRPRELMFGKVVGLGVISLLQMVVWLAVGTLVIGEGMQILGASLQVTLPPGFVVYALLYALLGYLVYASALAAIGALAPGVREGAQFQVMVLAPLIVPMMFNYILVEDPNGVLSTVLSLFPLTAPVSMVMRLIAVPVPVWQIALGLALLAGTAYLLVLLSARFFRADTLLSGTALDLKRFAEAFRGSA